MAKNISRTRKKPPAPDAQNYKHPESTSPLRPDVGVQPQFKKTKPPSTYRYDSSLSPAMEWDGQNAARAAGQWLLDIIAEWGRAPNLFRWPQELKGMNGEILHRLNDFRDAMKLLKAIQKPFLNWAGKAERLSFDVPTLPLFVHERLSTKAIIETLKGHKRDKQLDFLSDLFGDPKHSISDQLLKAYEYRDKWVNRLILGDSLVVMNSLLQYEGLGGQVQMIYMDPPYGVKFGSNFQPFVRKRDVGHNDDEDMTREPEMVKAYRDTWELGLHSYLTYMRDRMLLARDLLASTGSVFVQISDENVHHVREILDEVFGAENACSIIVFAKTTSASGNNLSSVCDYLLWYARDISLMKYRQLYLPRTGEGWVNYDYVRLPDGIHRRMTAEERNDWSLLPEGSKVYRRDNLTSQRPANERDVRVFEFNGTRFTPGSGTFKTDLAGLQRLAADERLESYGKTLSYRRFASDFPFLPLNNQWTDTQTGGYAEDRYYVVQTNTKVVQRCLLMTTDPGDLVLDPTCGSGTTAYVAEQWGRRWIAVDTSRVPLALARQRILTATHSYYQLKDEVRGPAGGFMYARKQNTRGEELGGVVPHVTLRSITNEEPPVEEVLVDRPEEDPRITRVTGPFCVEATIPTPVEWEGSDHVIGKQREESSSNFDDRMLDVLRRAPVVQVGGGNSITLKNVRRPAKTLSLSAEAVVTEGEPAVAIVFGPENGAISEKVVHEALKEANLKGYSHLYFIGFAIQPTARELIEKSLTMGMLASTYVQATMDLMMGDLLKNMRSSQIFSVCGLPEVSLRRVKSKQADVAALYKVELLGLDVFDPSTMEVAHRSGDDVPAWFLDTDYNGLCFHVCQAFFPRTSAWDNLKKSLRGIYEESVWDHLASAASAPFEPGEHKQVAVKVIDDRGNELLVVRNLSEAVE